jgi:hypothetical protein
MSSASSFPLYDTLSSVIQAQLHSQLAEASIDRPKFVKWIHTLDQDGKNKIYALIRYYDLHHPQHASVSEILPFGGHFVNNELTFDLNRFPLELQLILYEFTKLHMKHMKDSQRIEKLRKKSQ